MSNSVYLQVVIAIDYIWRVRNQLQHGKAKPDLNSSCVIKQFREFLKLNTDVAISNDTVYLSTFCG